MTGASDDVRLAIGGDRDAFARLYRRYARGVFVELAARLRRRQDAEDALQAAFLAAWTNLPRLRRVDRFVPWLFRIARNKARDQMRRPQPRLTLLGGREDLIAPDSSDPPDVEALRVLLGRLRPATRALVMLRAVEGWSAKEVGAALRMSEATVRRRYARALEHLRVAMAGREHDGKPQPSRASPRVGL